MKKYEALFIIEPNAASERFDQVKNTISQDLEKYNGTVGETKELGVKKLCYPIKRFTEGFYFLVEFNIEPNEIMEVRSRFKLNADIIRFLISTV